MAMSYDWTGERRRRVRAARITFVATLFLPPLLAIAAAPSIRPPVSVGGLDGGLDPLAKL